MIAPLAASAPSASAAAAAVADIRDIRGPIAIPYWWLPYAYAAGALCVVALGYGVYRYLRRRRADRVRSATEIALERIDRAAGQAKLGEHTSAGLSAELSDAVRSYLEARFALRAPQSTTEEFLHQLVSETGSTSASHVAAHRVALEDFLSWCDLAKFAQLSLTGEHADALVAAARQVVEATAAPVTAAAGKHERSSLPTTEVAA